MTKKDSSSRSLTEIFRFSDVKHTTTDEKGRITLPISFYNALPEGSHLMAVNLAQNQGLQVYLFDKASIDGDAAKMLAPFACPIRLDSLHRINLPLDFQEASLNITNESGHKIALVGRGQYFEILPAAIWAQREAGERNKAAEALARILNPSSES